MANPKTEVFRLVINELLCLVDLGFKVSISNEIVELITYDSRYKLSQFRIDGDKLVISDKTGQVNNDVSFFIGDPNFSKNVRDHIIDIHLKDISEHLVKSNDLIKKLNEMRVK